MGVALHAGVRPDLVCIDTGCNQIILVDLNDIDDYEEEPENSYLLTAQADARLVIKGRGLIGENHELHIPGVTTNLMSTHSWGRPSNISSRGRGIG